MLKKTIPPLGGVCSYEDACKIGYTVDDNVELLKRYNYVKVRLMEIATQHMNRTPEWEVKGALSYHVWLDTEHSTLLRKRVSEMREPPIHMDKVPDERLKTFMDEVLHSATTVELIQGIYGIVRPALLAAIKRHIQETNPLVDQPTVRALEWISLEEEKMLKWGAEAIEALTSDEQNLLAAKQWDQHLTAYLSVAGGIRGDDELKTELLPKRSEKPYEPVWAPQRDERFTDIWNHLDTVDQRSRDESADPEERAWALLYKRIREMDVPEMISSIVAQTHGKPWEYYNDMCRQIWDEVRHSMMGEVAFVERGADWTKMPIPVTWSFELNTLLTADERHAVLYDIEFGLMPGDTGKKFEWETAKKSGHPLAILFHDHDWADEVLHAQIGRKWFVSRLKDPKEVFSIAHNAYKKLDETRPDYKIENTDWWSDFYEKEIKSKKKTS